LGKTSDHHHYYHGIIKTLKLPQIDTKKLIISQKQQDTTTGSGKQLIADERK